MDTPQRWTAASGSVLTLRAVAPTDVGAMARFIDGLSLGTTYFRFGRLSIQFSADELAAMCARDPGSGRHLVVAAEHNGGEVLIASAHYFPLADEHCCEMEILVADAWQGHRVAHRLLRALAQSATSDGLQRMFATVLPTNQRMIRFAQRHGFKPVGGSRQSRLRTLCLELDTARIPD
jgi:RimJ/RimL family protein N-acetyltransferase